MLFVLSLFADYLFTCGIITYKTGAGNSSEPIISGDHPAIIRSVIAKNIFFFWTDLKVIFGKNNFPFYPIHLLCIVYYIIVSTVCEK